MRISLDDTLYEKLSAYADAVKLPPDKFIARQLARFVDYPVSQRLVVLTKEPLHELETLLGGPQLRTPEQVVERVKAYSSVYLGEIRLPLTPAQLEEIAYRAEKQGKTPQAVMEDLVAQLLPLLFHDTVGTR